MFLSRERDREGDCGYVGYIYIICVQKNIAFIGCFSCIDSYKYEKKLNNSLVYH